jgi:hypothetical protein
MDLRLGAGQSWVEVSGGSISHRLPAGFLAWLYRGVRAAGHRGEVRFKRGLLSSK